MADDLKIEKQKVYRYIKKNHIKEALQKNGVMYYDEAVQKQIKTNFFKKNHVTEAHQEHINEAVIDTLKKQLEVMQKNLDVLGKQLEEKDKQIERLDKKLENSQNLHGREQEIFGKTVLALEDKQKPKRWYQLWRKEQEKDSL